MNLITQVKNSLPQVISIKRGQIHLQKKPIWLIKSSSVKSVKFSILGACGGGPIGTRVPLSGSMGSTFSGLVVDIIKKLYAQNKKITEQILEIWL